VLKRGTRHVVNRASAALRLAASALLRSQSALGAKFRRLRSKLGAPKAITAMAHMLATTTRTEESPDTKPNTNTNNYSESENRPPLSICNSFLLLELSVRLGELPVIQPQSPK
jgi:hypothetical protein